MHATKLPIQCGRSIYFGSVAFKIYDGTDIITIENILCSKCKSFNFCKMSAKKKKNWQKYIKKDKQDYKIKNGD